MSAQSTQAAWDEIFDPLSCQQEKKSSAGQLRTQNGFMQH